MSSRKGIPSAFDSPEMDSPSAWDAAIYGELAMIDKGKIDIESIPIRDIDPDPKQPRRVIPSAVRQVCRVESVNMKTVFQKWLKMAEKECNLSIPLSAIQRMTDGPAEEEAEEEEPLFPEGMTEANTPITVGLLKVISLAASIKQEGLTNAITVVRQGRRYMINTGERRWLSYHLLAWLYGKEWELIPAQPTAPNVWKQASENLSREDLSGIALARQFALLVMACYPNVDWDADFDPEAVCDRPFYAQVADGTVWRIPRGKGSQIATTMGVGETMLRKYRQFLNLPDEIWIKADDECWSSNAVYQWILDTNKAEKPSHTVLASTVSPDGQLLEQVEKERIARNTESSMPALSQYVPTPEEAGLSPEMYPSQQAIDYVLSANLPAHATIVNLDKGEDDDTFVPQDDLTAARVREAKVRLAIDEIMSGAGKLMETISVQALNALDKNTQASLANALLTTIRREDGLFTEIANLMADQGYDHALPAYQRMAIAVRRIGQGVETVKLYEGLMDYVSPNDRYDDATLLMFYAHEMIEIAQKLIVPLSKQRLSEFLQRVEAVYNSSGDMGNWIEQRMAALSDVAVTEVRLSISATEEENEEEEEV